MNLREYVKYEYAMDKFEIQEYLQNLRYKCEYVVIITNVNNFFRSRGYVGEEDCERILEIVTYVEKILGSRSILLLYQTEIKVLLS